MKKLLILVAFILLTFSAAQARNKTKQDEINSAFFTEVYNGNLDAAKAYIENGQVTEDYYKDKNIAYQLIARSALSGNEALLDYLISKGVDVNLTSSSGASGLHITTWEGNLKASKLLVKHGANTEAFYNANGGLTPLRTAAESGNLELVQYLISKTPSQQKMLQGESIKAIYGVANKGHYDVFAYLAEKAPFDYDWRDTLFNAIYGQNIDIVKYIVEQKNVSVNEKLEYRELPIQEAAGLRFVKDDYKTVDLMKYLVSQGAKLSDINNGEIFPWVIKNSTKPVIEYLMAEGFKPDMDSYYNTDSSPWGWEPLPAMLDNENFLLAQYIVDDKDMKGTDPYFREEPLIIYFLDGIGSANIIDFLIKNEINKRHYDQAFLHSIINRDKESAVLLLKAGADINTKDEKGHSALYYIWEKEIGSYLVEQGIDKYNPKTIADAIDNFILLQYFKEIDLDPQLTESMKNEGLLTAARLGDEVMVQYFIDASADINTTTKKTSDAENTSGYRHISIAGQTPMITNSMYGYDRCSYKLTDNKNVLINPSVAKLLIQAGADINHQDSKGNAAIHYASGNQECRIFVGAIPMGSRQQRESGAHGDPAFPYPQYHDLILEELILAGANVNLQNNDGDTALILAAKNNNNQIIRLLINAGADINIKNNEGKSLLDLAGSFNDIELMNEIGLLDKLDDKMLNQLFKKFFGCGYPKSEEIDKTIREIELLLAKGVDIDTQYYNQTLLMACIDHGSYKHNKKMINYLISKGIDINAIGTFTNSRKLTALMLAAANYGSYDDTLDLIKLLIDSGADINIQDQDGSTVLIHTEYDDDDLTLKLSQMVINAGADVDIKNINGKSALTIALVRGKLKTAELLKQSGAKRDIASEWEYATKIESFRGNIEYTQKLIAEGVDVNMVIHDYGNKEITALMFVIKENHSNHIKALIDAGADLKATDKNGKTVLDYLKYSDPNTMETIEILEESGLEIPKDVYSKFLQKLSNKDEHKELIEKLINLGADVNYVNP